MSLLYWIVSIDSFQGTLLLQAFAFLQSLHSQLIVATVDSHSLKKPKAQDSKSQHESRLDDWMFPGACLGIGWVQFGQAKTVYALTSLDGFTQPIQLKQSLGLWETSKTFQNTAQSTEKSNKMTNMICKSIYFVSLFMTFVMSSCLQCMLAQRLLSFSTARNIHNCSISCNFKI